jgi:hypothetical protein
MAAAPWALAPGIGGAAGTGSPESPAVAPWFKDGPPARTTGGFGEESCVGCHFGAEENDGVGRIEIEGVPEGFAPGERYPITVRLIRPGIGVGGFQVAARYADGLTQAGSFEVPHDEELRVGILRERGIEFPHHTYDGVALSGTDEVSWRLIWVAPEDATSSVYFHAAGVAADDDDSQAGDLVYTTATESEALQSR